VLFEAISVYRFFARIHRTGVIVRLFRYQPVARNMTCRPGYKSLGLKASQYPCSARDLSNIPACVLLRTRHSVPYSYRVFSAITFVNILSMETHCSGETMNGLAWQCDRHPAIYIFLAPLVTGKKRLSAKSILESSTTLSGAPASPHQSFTEPRPRS
jgi:hypothetical protein